LFLGVIGTGKFALMINDQKEFWPELVKLDWQKDIPAGGNQKQV
jgi:hypothetical protein